MSAQQQDSDGVPSRFGVREATALALIAAVGILDLPTPLWGDQALFALVAQSLAEGGALYRELWDMKQPGIYLFYLLGGGGFGFSEVGIHLLELVWQLMFALVLLRTGPCFLKTRTAVFCLPLMTIGLYLAAVGPHELTQVEGLVGFPLYLAFWFSLGKQDAWRSTRCLFLAGLAGACVALFKLLLMPIVAGVWLAALALRLGPAPASGRLREALRFARPLCAGALLPLLAYLVYAVVTGTLGLALWTSFVFPLQFRGLVETVTSRAAESSVWFLRAFAPAGLLAAWGVAGAVRARRLDRVLGGAAVWLVLGLALVAAEVWWWTYYLLVLLVPLGLVAARGIDEVLRRGRSARIVTAAVALAACAWPGSDVVGKMRALARHHLAWSPWNRMEYQCEVLPRYRVLGHEADFIRSRTEPGTPIYVFGDPTLIYLADMRYAIPINAWSLEEWTPALWAGVDERLRGARPAYVFVRKYAERAIRRNQPSLLALLAGEYDVVRSMHSGTWYHRKPAGPEP